MEPANLAAIESFRASHDPQAAFIKAHLTLVFPVDADAEELAQEAHVIVASTPSFAVNLSAVRASVGIDGRSYALLEPDAGQGIVAELHDRLYSGILARHLRSDVAYEPHVTIGSCGQLADCIQMASGFNASWSPSLAHIDELTLIDLDASSPRESAVFALQVAAAQRVTTVYRRTD